jgi:hypothetical protein
VQVAERDSLTSGEKKLLKLFGSNVRAIRERKKQSVYDLTGDDMPITNRQHWQMIENGKKNIQLVTVFKIAKSLEVDPAELFK